MRKLLRTISPNAYLHRLKSDLLIILTLILCSLRIGAVEYHVSTTGNNLNPGSAASPFLTIQKAANVMVAGDVCVIHAGTYREEVTPTANSVTFQSAPGETVLISGFEQVTNWTWHSGDIYSASMGFSDLGDRNQVLYNDQMMNLARWPNKTNYDPFDLEAPAAWGTTASISHGTLPDLNWGDGGVVWYLGKSRWTSWRVPATGAAAGIVYFDTLPTSWDYSGSHSPANGGEVILMNILEALDSEGEWYIDRAADTVYFDVPGAGDPDSAPYPVQIRARTRVFNLSSKTGVILSGLHMEGGKVDLEGANGCVVKNCRIYYGNHTIANSSSFRIYDTSIDMNSGTVNCSIYRNDIQWGAGNGIILDGTGNRVDNNHIGNFNYVGSYATAIWFIGEGNQLTRNQIFNAGRDTINGGGDGCDVGYNDIHHSNMINDDCGGIYTCCNNDYNFTRIHHNWFHDIQSRNTPFDSYKGAGVYLDNTSREVIVDHNVMWNLEWSCIQFNWAGKDLLLYNNTLWSNDLGLKKSKSIGWWQNGYSITNIPLYNTLANNADFVSTDEQNTVLYAMGTDPFEDLAGTNFMPQAGTTPIDAGRLIPPFTDGFVGAAPDAGAYERGGIHWLPGPDWAVGEAVTDDDYRPLVGLYVSLGAGTVEIEDLSAFADYRIEMSADLMGNWTPIHDFTAPYTGMYGYTDVARTNQSLFYRVVELLPTDPPIGGWPVVDLDFTSDEGFSDGVDIDGKQNMNAQSTWDAGDTAGTGYATSVGQWQRARNHISFTLDVGQSVVIETALRLMDADGNWDNADVFTIGFGDVSQHAGASTPSIGSAIHTFTDGSYWFGGDSATNRISVSAADSGDWIKFTQTITRSATANQFTCTISAVNLTDEVDLRTTASSWTQSTSDGSWGGSMTASFRTWQNAKATALQIDRWRVTIP